MSYVLALDQGTTSSRALVFDRDGEVAGLAQQEFRQIFPRPGWVEHDAEQIWETQLATARQAIHEAGIEAAAIAAIGITNQRETTVVWERASGKPVANAIVWQDRRTAGRCDRLRRAPHAAEIRARTGLQLDPYFSGTKVAWILDQDPALRRRALAGELAFGTVDSWLVWNLTAGRVHVTDASNASRTMLFDIRKGAWDPELAAWLDVPVELLPEVVDSSGRCGLSAPDVLGAAIPICGIAGDQQAALFGQLCIEPGMAKNTYGTGCFMLLNTGADPIASESGLLTTVAWRIDGETVYALEGSVFIGGAVVQWLRDELGIIETAADVEPLAASVPDSGGVYCVPAFTGLGAPHWDAYARGTIVGLTRGTGAAHLARAALEGIAFQVADVMDAMQADSGVELGELRVDGGAAANELLLQIQADVLQAPVVRPHNLETTALGAAYLAGLGAGVWASPAELATRWRAGRRVEPGADPEDVAARRAGWSRALERARGWEQPEDSDAA